MVLCQESAGTESEKGKTLYYDKEIAKQAVTTHSRRIRLFGQKGGQPKLV